MSGADGAGQGVAPRVDSITVGRVRIHAIQAGALRLDGGAMFGVVPKPLWERRAAADARNRIQLGMRCLVIEHELGLVLVDTGLGNKEDAKFRDIYGVENGGDAGRTWLEDGLRQLGHAPEDVAMVVNTHLHFDHAGGNSYVDGDGAVRPTFPNARHLVQRGEYAYATATNERTAGSYFARNFVPVHDARLFDFVDGEREIAAGLRVRPTPGHVPHHQSVLLESNGERAIFLADVMPTTAHLPLPWIMGYDVEPLVTLESKRRLLRDAVDGEWLLIFEHDPTVAWARVEADGTGYALRGA